MLSNFLYFLKHGRECDKCAASWEERGYEDIDCGCYINADYEGGYWKCKLPFPIFNILVWKTLKKQNYYYNHEYDDFEEHYKQREYEQDKLIEIVKKNIKDSELVKGPTGEDIILQIYFDYNEATAKPYKSLKTRWKELFKETYKIKVYDKIMPYFERER